MCFQAKGNMRRSALILSIQKTNVEYYLDYLKRVDKDLPILQDVFPKLPARDEDVIEFHTKLCSVMKDNNYRFKGIKVTPLSNETVRSLHGTKPICVPVFSNFFQDKTFSKNQCRLQYVEPAICFKIGDISNPSALGKCVSYFPAIEVVGTRFPFYPPSISGFACDLCSSVGFSVGTENKLTSSSTKTLPGYHFVLLHDDDPIQVGCLNLSSDDPLQLINLAHTYASKIGCPLQEGHFILCSGVSPRTPAKVGDYTIQWGAFGTATCTIV
ncbi:unnamed protein product [Phytomonas sp. EM1]|nr:unnamed protein product [Phytomonas sp. EM1]|eukprot:CCW61722.1 unnamed protein product [Phytomonas sp. isolate EM1]